MEALYVLGDDEGNSPAIIDDLPLQRHLLLEGQGGVDVQGHLTA